MITHLFLRVFSKCASRIQPLFALIGVSLGLALAGISPVHANTYTVTTVSDTGPGLTLRSAMTSANQHGGSNVINFTPGVTGTMRLAAELPSITSDLTLQGPGARVLSISIIRDSKFSQHPFPIFSISSQMNVSISGLTIDGGYDPTAPPAPNGGSVAASNGSIVNFGALNLTDCVVSGGHSHDMGGGITNVSGQLNISRCTIFNNHTAGSGGGIWNAGTLSIMNSTVCSNSSESVFSYGGGLYNTGTADIRFCTFNDNAATGFQDTSGYDPNIWGQTVIGGDTGGGSGGSTGTAAPGPGNSIFGNGGVVQLSNTILSSRPTEFGSVTPNFNSINHTVRASGGYNITTDDTGPNRPTDRLNTDPILDPAGPQYNGGPTPAIALLYNSPAIDTANPASAGTITTDQRGLPRPYGAGPDVGAFEFQPVLRLIVTNVSPSRITAGVVNVTLILQNTGTVPVQNIRVTSAKLNNIPAAAINDNFSLEPGATRGLTMSFNNGNKGIPGGYLPFILNGTYTGGSFNVGVRLNVPSP